MFRLSEWFVHRKEYLTLLAAIILSLSLIFSNDDLQIQTVKAWTFGGFGYILDKIAVLRRYDAVYEENQWLREKSAELMLENSRLKEAMIENQRLRQLLGFKSKSQLDLIAAKVVGKDKNGFVNSIFLAAGSVDSLEKNMAVVTAQGLAGKIYNVSRYNSTAQLLLDRNFRVSAMIQRSRVTGIIKWHQGDHLMLAEVPRRSDVTAGDTVITSGLSTIFPGGLEIGRVLRVDEDIQGMFMSIFVKPTVDFTKLEEVFIIRMQQVHSN